MTRSLLMLLAGTGVGLILSAGTAQAESLREAVEEIGFPVVMA